MKRVKFYMSCGYAGAEHTEVIEFDDDATEVEIEETFREWVWGYIDCYAEEVEE